MGNRTYAIVSILLFSVSTLGLLVYLLTRRIRENDAAPSQETPTRGLDREMVESFPTMLYSEVKNYRTQQRGTLECAICISEFDDDDTLQLLPGCNHAFHLDCISKWLESRTSCPVCRIDLASSAVHPEVPLVLPKTTSHSEEGDSTPVQVVVQLPNDEKERGQTSDDGGKIRIWTEEERERFTLTLPEDVRAELMARRLERSVTMDCRILKSFDIDMSALIGRTWSLGSPLGGRWRRKERHLPSSSPAAAGSQRRFPSPSGTSISCLSMSRVSPMVEP